MTELVGDIWDFWDAGAWITVTTNGTVKRDGSLVMGRGIAKEAMIRFPELPLILGHAVVKSKASRVFRLDAFRILAFPVKHRFYEGADLNLIRRSARELVALAGALPTPIYLVRPGCGNGGLDWATVKPILAPMLDHRFVVVERAP